MNSKIVSKKAIDSTCDHFLVPFYFFCFYFLFCPNQ